MNACALLRFATLVVLNFALTAIYAAACVCPPDCLEYRPGDVVFIGQVKSLSLRLWFTQEQTATFSISRILQGSISGGTSSSVRVNAGVPTAGMCGYRFKRGMTYLVHARMSKGRLQTSICTRTGPIKEATDDVQRSGPSFLLDGSSVCGKLPRSGLRGSYPVRAGN